jgi:hypothetical protein
LKLSINNKEQLRTKREIYCSNNKLAEQSAKISKLEHNATEQGWTTKNNMLKYMLCIIKCQDLKFEWRVKNSIPGERVSSFIIYRY